MAKRRKSKKPMPMGSMDKMMKEMMGHMPKAMPKKHKKGM